MDNEELNPKPDISEPMPSQPPETPIQPHQSVSSSPKKPNSFLKILSLALISVLVICGAAYGSYSWEHGRANKKEAAQQAQIRTLTTELSIQNNTISSTSSKSGQSSDVLNVSNATTLLSKFYNQYIADAPNSNLKAIVAQYGTANLISYDSPTSGGYDEDPIICAQDTPASFRVVDVAAASNDVVGTINEDFGNDAELIKATVVSQKGILKIDSITCSPALTPSTGGE